MKTKIFFIQFDYSHLYMFYSLNYDNKYQNSFYREELSCDAIDFQKEMQPVFEGTKNDAKIKELITDLFDTYNFQQFYKDAEKLKIWNMSN